jgi:hypothetical protein
MRRLTFKRTYYYCMFILIYTYDIYDRFFPAIKKGGPMTRISPLVTTENAVRKSVLMSYEY